MAELRYRWEVLTQEMIMMKPSWHNHTDKWFRLTRGQHC